ncbi:hypothetical protein [Dendronalium sp. ChiSLP03b]|uniref:hypothetical protein n=1 Tax=Dendronalium sp. ChiSLP03b TaxID=3075381 RepID=UPI00267A8AB4|nr:hypothetical protein [Dendronalium sp. ChiSLP03b]MDZ8208576.1 hypothetical protein [Dendronalium sp. ChiSLP03b]
MSISTAIQQTIQAITEITSQVINYILGAVSRIFGPRDDNYPSTGTQPFEGDPPKKKHY